MNKAITHSQESKVSKDFFNQQGQGLGQTRCKGCGRPFLRVNKRTKHCNDCKQAFAEGFLLLPSGK